MLPVLHDLLRTRSTTETARRLGCKQSTVSHALARLRRSFRDPLLVRVGRSLAPTRFAEDLAPRLEAAIAGVARLYERSSDFEPSSCDRAFVLAGTDFSEAMILPGLMRRLAKDAPRVDVQCEAAAADVERAIQLRDVDLAFGTLFRDRAGLVVKKVATDELVLVMRRGHPRAAGKGRLDAKTFAALGQVLVAPRGQPGGAVDVALAELSLSRRVVVRVRHFSSALALVAKTELVTSMPRRFALAMAPTFGLVLRDLPFRPPRFTFSLAYNVQVAHDPAHQWFRRIVEESVRELFAAPPR
ncbi:MAG: LysR family transcriptional regulator [Deltaproteobacteria bacterium]|nr:LysR family transcriptional regulator [Deltaproteobacteria bacterium]